MSALESRLSLWGPITRSGSDLHSSLFSSFGVYILNNTYVYFFMVCLVFSSIYTTLLEETRRKCLTLHWPRSWCIHHFTSLVWVQRLDHSHHDILVGKRKRNNGLNPSINGEEMLHTNWNAKIYEEVLQCFWGLVSCCWPQENEPHYKWTSASLMSLSLSGLSGHENER